MINTNYPHSELTSRIIGCSMEVHRTIGSGFQELIYQRALAHEFLLQGINFSREYEMPVCYKGVEVGRRRVDFLVDNIISVELKAVAKLENVHLAQAINYLEVYNLQIGLLLNFGALQLEFKRLNNKKFKDQN